MRRLLIVAIFIGIVAFTSTAGFPIGAAQSDADMPLPASPVAGPDGCYLDPRPLGFFESLPATPVAVRDRDSLIRAFRGAPAVEAQSDLTAVTRTIDTAVFCQNLGDFARLSALFSDEYWLGEVAGLEAKGSEFALMMTAPPQPPIEQMEHLWSFGDARLLADGRIAGFLRWDQRDIEDTQLVAFRLVDGQWLFDEVVFASEPEVLGQQGI